MNLKKKTNKNIKINAGNTFLTSAIAAVILGILGVSYIREHSLSLFPVKKYEATQKDIQEWLNAVKSGDEKKAILYASRIIPDDAPTLPDPDYIQLLLNNGLTIPLLTSPFSHFDFLRWKDAYEIKKIADNAKANFKSPVMELFQQVLTKKKYDATSDSMSLYEMFQVKISQYKNAPYVSIIDTWNKGYASMAELCRLFSAVAYQLGYDVVIIGIYDDSYKLTHFLCEVRKNDESYLCDLVNRKIWTNTTFKSITENPDILKGIWPEKIIDSLQRSLHRIPSEAMDYKLYNQQLYNRLRKSGTLNLPKFGESPQARIESYISKYENKREKRRFLYWNFPFKSLMSSPDFPQEWRSPMLNQHREKEGQRKITNQVERSAQNK